MNRVVVAQPTEPRERYEFDPTNHSVEVSVSKDTNAIVSGVGGWLGGIEGYFVAVFFLDARLYLKVNDDIWHYEDVDVVLDGGLHIEAESGGLSLPLKSAEELSLARAITNALTDPDKFQWVLFGDVRESH